MLNIVQKDNAEPAKYEIGQPMAGSWTVGVCLMGWGKELVEASQVTLKKL